MRPFQETRLEEAGLTVLVPSRPQWVLSLTPMKRNQRIELSTPPNYYPATSIQIVRDAELSVLVDDLDSVAASAMQSIRSGLGMADPLTPGALQDVRVGNLTGFEDNFSIRQGDAEYDLRNIVGALPSGHLVSILVSTPAGQIAHIEHIVEKILVNLREL
ncbi:hypothetical protein [Granulosicoccus antarcticus]|uniref:hypothetical protein n=1 Tax=Granulosicoccus antarcticus TaxID=437505 RepID=UPI0012FDFC07|nr:hypothetical protein [Granulosicoccus antarcticus]